MSANSHFSAYWERKMLSEAIEQDYAGYLLYDDVLEMLESRYSSHTVRRFKHAPAQNEGDTLLILASALTRDYHRRCRVGGSRWKQQNTRINILELQFERAWVPVICDKIYSTLPREVRDMIWNNLYCEQQGI